MKNIEVFEFLNSLFPCEHAMDFDNVGFLVGDRNVEVKKVLVTLDCDRTAVQKAIDTQCSLIVTHHPVIFGGLKSVTENDIVFELIKNGIAVISMHTNLDVGINGGNDCLCAAVDFDECALIPDDEYRLLRVGHFYEGISAHALAERLHNALHTRIKYVDGGNTIKKVLLCGGSGGDLFHRLRTLECDALLTADVKHNVFIDAINQGLTVFDAGHYATEDVVVEPLASAIRAHFTDLDVITHHHDRIIFA